MLNKIHLSTFLSTTYINILRTLCAHLTKRTITPKHIAKLIQLYSRKPKIGYTYTYIYVLCCAESKYKCELWIRFGIWSHFTCSKRPTLMECWTIRLDANIIGFDGVDCIFCLCMFVNWILPTGFVTSRSTADTHIHISII